MIFTRGLRVCLALKPADLRRSFDGLALLVREELKENECSSQIFVFTNKRRNRIRLLYWDGTGLWLMTKSHAPQCSHWFFREDPLSLSPAFRERIRSVWLRPGQTRPRVYSLCGRFGQGSAGLDV